MKQVYKDIYLEELELPNNPLKYLNLYIIKGKEKSMIIDTGFNMEKTKKSILDVMEKLNLTFQNTILYLTHLHSDHTGLANFLSSNGMITYISKVDGDILNDENYWDDLYIDAIKQGLGQDKFKVEEHPGYKYSLIGKLDYKEAVIGNTIQIGDYNFEIIDLCGHTPGQTGLYEKKHKILFCGDHILGKITPNITFWGFKYGDSLRDYFKNLDKVYNMDIDYLFSSHRFLIDNHRIRIEELKNHHNNRLDEVKIALREKKFSTVRDVTQKMHWDIKYENFENFPQSQKSFAVGEAHAHLEYLRTLGEVDYVEKDGLLYYYLVNK